MFCKIYGDCERLTEALHSDYPCEFLVLNWGNIVLGEYAVSFVRYVVNTKNEVAFENKCIIRISGFGNKTNLLPSHLTPAAGEPSVFRNRCIFI